MLPPQLLQHFIAQQKHWRLLGICIFTTLLTGCAGYYLQLFVGQLTLFSAHEPISTILDDPERDPKLKDRLGKVLEAREFASAKLDLPDNNSYREYADVQRKYVVWNVFATPEFSTDAVRHCFPITGCVAYRGYFDENAAREKAAELKAQNMDTMVSGIDAYSTLGWFSDPLLNTMLRRSDEQLAGLIFHELTHQKLYVQGDTAFNESYASFVEREGQKEWRTYKGLPEPKTDRKEVYREMVSEFLATRERLKALYATNLPPEEMRLRKQEEFSRLRQTHHRWKEEKWGGKGYFDHWFKQPLNNASLLPFGLYDQWVAAFAELFRQQKGNWPAFHAAVAELGKKSPQQRNDALNQLMAEGQAFATEAASGITP